MSIITFAKKEPRQIGILKFQEEIKKHRLTEFYKSCCICGWNKTTIDLAHFVPHKDGGKYLFDNILPLCPNHHRQWDREIINDDELECIQFFLWNISNILASY